MDSSRVPVNLCSSCLCPVINCAEPHLWTTSSTGGLQARKRHSIQQSLGLTYTQKGSAIMTFYPASAVHSHFSFFMQSGCFLSSHLYNLRYWYILLLCKNPRPQAGNPYFICVPFLPCSQNTWLWPFWETTHLSDLWSVIPYSAHTLGQKTCNRFPQTKTFPSILLWRHNFRVMANGWTKIGKVSWQISFQKKALKRQYIHKMITNIEEDQKFYISTWETLSERS